MITHLLGYCLANCHTPGIKIQIFAFQPNPSITCRGICHLTWQYKSIIRFSVETLRYLSALQSVDIACREGLTHVKCEEIDIIKSLQRRHVFIPILITNTSICETEFIDIKSLWKSSSKIPKHLWNVIATEKLNINLILFRLWQVQWDPW